MTLCQIVVDKTKVFCFYLLRCVESKLTYIEIVVYLFYCLYVKFSFFCAFYVFGCIINVGAYTQI